MLIKKVRKKLTNILRLNISMNEVTLVMKIFEAKKNLFGDNLYKRARDPLLLVSLYQPQEVFTQRFEYDADM